MPRISLNVVVYNEEARLEECLTDARDHVDEIVVVDQMSTDATPEIARRLADVYVSDVQHGHAEPSRELAAARSSGDWLLILDADERMSEALKAALPHLVMGAADGYWIEKVNLVDGAERNRIDHFRLVRKTRAQFDPRPHGGAIAVTENIERFPKLGILHAKSLVEQIVDDARYERMALEDAASTSSKRNWLSHNSALRADREQARRTDLEALLPTDTARAMIVGDLHVELPGCALLRVDRSDLAGTIDRLFGDGESLDAVLFTIAGDDDVAILPEIAALLRPGGVIAGTARVGRNRRQIETFVSAVLTDGTPPRLDHPAGVTRRRLAHEFSAAGLQACWMRLVRDAWLDPLPLRPDGGGSVVESEDFLLRNVSSEVTEELTADHIVFAAARPASVETVSCTVVVGVSPGGDPRRFAEALRESSPEQDHELVVVASDPSALSGVRSVSVSGDASLAARWNAGARAARGELLVFVSADSTPCPGWLDLLIQTHHAQADTGAVGSRLLAEDGTVEHCGLVLGGHRLPYRIYEGEPGDAPHVNRSRIMPAVAADGMAVSRARFVEVGGFDETLGDDLPDVDLCLRLRARGLAIQYCSGAVLQSRPRSSALDRARFRRSAREFTARWSPATVRSDELICLADRRNHSHELNRSWRLPRPGRLTASGLPAIVWTSHFLEHGGYTEEALAAVEALDDAGLPVIANPVWPDGRGTALPAEKNRRLAELMDREVPDRFVHVLHVGAQHFKRHPAAVGNVGRTMYETDGLPPEWRDQCNAMDEIWVPCEHNLHSFANAGVQVSKLHKVPETLDSALFDPGVEPLALEGVEGFVFLSVFSWIERKGWDVLLRAWFEEFAGQDDVTLVLKTDAALAPKGTNVRREVDAFVRQRLGRDPVKGPRVVVLERGLELTEVPRLYRAADAFVLPSRGEGWGRPYMEAMAMQLPTIATAWSGNLDFMTEQNSYLIDFRLVPAPLDNAWLRGHRWAEPSARDLRRAMRSIYENRQRATERGQQARRDVLTHCRPELVAEAVRDRVEAIDRRASRPAARGRPAPPGSAAAVATSVAAAGAPSVTACVVVRSDRPALRRCLASLHALTDAIIVTEAEPDAEMAAVRNAALERATGNWVLMLDASQTLDPASVDLIRELVEQDRFVGYAAREVRQHGLDGAVSAVERRAVVLFPRADGLRYVGHVDEQLLPRDPSLGFRLEPSRIVLHNHDRHQDAADPQARARRQLPLLERSARETPGEAFHLYNLGAGLRVLGLLPEAETALRSALGAASPGTLWEPSAYVALARTVAGQHRVDEAVSLARRATKLAPGWAHGWCTLGDVRVRAGRLKAALRAYDRALSCGQAAWLPTDVPDDTAWQLRAGMAKIHLQRREPERAVSCLEGAVALRPDNAELHRLLARAHDALGHAPDALRHAERATRGVRGGAEGFAALADLFTRKADDALLRGMVENPESDMLRLQIERLRGG